MNKSVMREVNMASMMATATSSEKSESLSEQEVLLKELHTFLNGATKLAKVRSIEVARAAIYLLKTLPAARDGVLEHMYNLFDESVSNYVLKLELDDNANVASNVASDEKIIQEVHQVLSDFIKQNPETWSPAISTWSLSLLGFLSSKYADRRVVPHPSNLPEVLQLWMACPPTRTLIDLTTQCLSTLISSNPDTCIDALIETSVQHSPYFDWVVAHIGSCFPMTVITRVLACGLKDFYMHQDVIEEATMGTNKKAPKIASVVGILGHLAAHHDGDIRVAVLSIFKDSFCDSASRQQLATGPFLLHLAAMSDVLSHVISSEFVKVVTSEVLCTMANQVEKWRSAKIPGTDEMVRLVVHLLLRSDGGSQVIRRLLDIVSPETPGLLPVVTIERDLHIKRMFEDNSILWDLLLLVATVHPALCYCSVLLRAIMGVLLSFWGSCQEKVTLNCAKQLHTTLRLINIMAVGQILPPPLSYIDEVIPLVTPYEAFSLLSDIWQYMHDNVPSPTLFSLKDQACGRVWRDFSSGRAEGNKDLCDKKYVSRLRCVLFANIEKFGPIYAKFFPADRK